MAQLDTCPTGIQCRQYRRTLGRTREALTAHAEVGHRFAATFLPDDAFAAVQSALPHACLLRYASWEHLSQIAESDCVTFIVIDPLIGGDGNLNPAISLLRSFPLTPILACVSLSAVNFEAIARLGTEGLFEVFLHPSPDAGRRLRALHEMLASETLAQQFLRTLGPSIGKLPAKVVRAIVDLFGRPHLYKSATDLAAQSDVIPRSLYRYFDAVRLGSPRKLVMAAKILRAYAHLQQHHLSVKHVTEKLGYGTVRVLAGHTAEIFGCCPSTLRKTSDAAEVVRQLLEWYYKPSVSSGRAQRLSESLAGAAFL